jgi:phage-related tail protein
MAESTGYGAMARILKETRDQNVFLVVDNKAIREVNKELREMNDVLQKQNLLLKKFVKVFGPISDALTRLSSVTGDDTYKLLERLVQKEITAIQSLDDLLNLPIEDWEMEEDSMPVEDSKLGGLPTDYDLSKLFDGSRDEPSNGSLTF